MKHSTKALVAAVSCAGVCFMASAPVAFAAPYPGSPAPETPPPAPAPAPQSEVVLPPIVATLPLAIQEQLKNIIEAGDPVLIALVNAAFAEGTEAAIYAIPGINGAPMRFALVAVHSARVAGAAAAPSNAIFLGNAPVGAGGVVSATIKIPASLVGKVTILAEGKNASGQTVTASQTITVSPVGTRAAIIAGATGGSGTVAGGLPFTGSDSIVPLAVMGAGALVLGAGLVAVSRRRKVALPAA